MERSELEIIKELMAELEAKMEPGQEDFEERLGRKKPGVEVVKIEGDLPEAKEEMPGEEMGEEVLEGEEMPEEMDPEAKLKARLMKLRA